MFDWQDIKMNSFFIRKVWTMYVIMTVIFAVGMNQQLITLGKLYFLAGALIFFFITYSILQIRLDRLTEKDLYYLQYLDVFLILLALSGTYWKIPVSFILYLSIMKTVFIYGMKYGLRLAILTGIGYSICYCFFGITEFTVHELQYLGFSFVGMILTVIVSGILKQQVKEVEETNVKLILRNSELYILQQVSNHVSSVLNIDDLFQLIPDILLGISGAKYVAIYLTEDETFSGLKLQATNYQKAEIFEELFTGERCHRIRDTFHNSKSSIEDTNTFGEFASVMSVPIRYQDHLMGVMVLTHYRSNVFTEKNLQLLEPVANQLGIAIVNARLYDQVKRMANLDGLTGVYNRKYFQDQLESFCKKKDPIVTLIMLDVDHFKKVNDTFGHVMGDQVLKMMTDVIGKVVEDQGILARYGGEEFVVLLPDKSVDEAYQIAEKLREQIHSQQIRYLNHSCQVSVSIGVAGNDLPDILTMDDLLNAADEALYHAKANGRNRTVRAS